MAESVRELTSAVASGQTEAFARLYRAWFDHVFHEARRCSGRDEQFCLDVAQETMLRVIRRIKPLDSEAALAAWLTAAARNACLDLLRKDLRLRRREQAYAQTRSTTTEDVDSGQTRERIAWLTSELSNLESASARALDLRYRMNWTLSRIGQALHLKTGAVDGRINRTISQLRAAAPSSQKDQHD